MKTTQFTRTISLIIIISFLSVSLPACSTHSNAIAPSYVSPILYQHCDCTHIEMEMMRLSRRVSEVCDQQDREATKDALAMTAGLLLFWPALFLTIGQDRKAEVARLKGEYEAIEIVAIEKKCNVSHIQAQFTRDTKMAETDTETAEKPSRVNRGTHIGSMNHRLREW